ncbi:MAG: [protein-PII] uridylyltransferase [Candidatus Nanopelagicaceae bacterium]|nr:[protein-PII] uridylyltransferase [Candidatus Nanopelagicaceae bacterium]
MGTRERRLRSNESDRELSQLFFAAAEKLHGEASRGVAGLALAAVGGVGRGELTPGSVLDILILHGDQYSDTQLLAFVNALLYPIWDGTTSNASLPRSVDHSVRTPSQTRDAAKADLKVAMGLLDIRFICGDSDLVTKVQQDALYDWRKESRKRLAELRTLLAERHERMGELAYLLEPDLKEARGGLRDITALRAIAKSGAMEIPLERISNAESSLSNIREALHLASNRGRDRLLFQEQDKVAQALRFADADELMGEVAQSARDVDYLMQSTWHRFDHKGKEGLFSRRAKFIRVGRGISVANQELVIDPAAISAHDPGLGLRAAAKAAQLGIHLSMQSCVQLAQGLKEGIGVLPNPWPREAREDLVALIGAGSAMIHVWEALDQEGLISAWLPEWSAVRSLPQRNFLHRHTVDRHMVETAVHAALRTRDVHRPDLLLVAALFHDIGKGETEDHSHRGARLIEPLARRIGFSEPDVATLKVLVEQHLLLAATATRRDLNDPATIISVLARIPDLQTLELLHALSIADGEATGSAAWSNWKATLVSDLVGRTRAAMSGTTVAPQPELTSEQRAFAEVASLRVEVVVQENEYALEVISPDRPGLLSIVAGVLNLARLDVRSARTMSHGPSAVMRWIVSLDPNAPVPTAEKIHDDIQAALAGHGDLEKKIHERAKASSQLPSIPVPPPVVQVVMGASSECTVIEVRSHDQPGLLFRIGDAVTRCRVDIRSAIVTTLGAEAIDTLYVTEIAAGPLSEKRAQEVVERLKGALL